MLLESTPLIVITTRTKKLLSWFGTVELTRTVTTMTVTWAATRLVGDSPVLRAAEDTHEPIYETPDMKLRSSGYTGVTRDSVLCEWQEVYESKPVWTRKTL